MWCYSPLTTAVSLLRLTPFCVNSLVELTRLNLTITWLLIRFISDELLLFIFLLIRNGNNVLHPLLRQILRQINDDESFVAPPQAKYAYFRY
ncbi:hypothetical protein PU00_11795 [Hafnia alvei]|nr:hypothetical protein PU00_11795 [Hafnia alvei]